MKTSNCVINVITNNKFYLSLRKTDHLNTEFGKDSD